jgi:subtilisin family serine protease
MSGTNDKMDSGLGTAYRAWAEHPELSPDGGITVFLTHEGDLADIEALGFETHSTAAGQVMGVVRFKDIPKLVAHPGVLRLATGGRKRKHLDTAVRDIKARATVGITGSTADGVWQAPVATGTLTSIAKGTGKGVIVAIIDTGIDITHPMFLSQLTPTKKTRILKIWDQGLTPTAITQCPDVSLLESTKRYGVEFDSTQIETHLNGGAKIAHKDCDGHGTHVAGIAAGGPLFPAKGDAKFMGVAPEADIIAVKFFDNPKVFFRKPDASPDGAEVESSPRLRDAIQWCLMTAKNVKPKAKPVVINLSLGDDGLPGDGLDGDAHWLDDRLDPKHAADDKHFPKGAIVVKSSGNEGDDTDRRVARIKMPHIAELTVPVLLVDKRHSADTDWKLCAQTLNSPSIGVHIWYRVAAGQTVTCSIKTPQGEKRSADAKVGDKLEIGFKPKTGSDPHDTVVPFAPNKHRLTLNHEDVTAVPHPKGGTVHRAHINFFVEPKVSAGTVTYYPGIYELLIKAPQDAEFWLECEEEWWNHEFVHFEVNDVEQGGTHIDPSEIKILQDFTSADPMGQNVITVAAYDDADGSTTSPKFHQLASFSSRGPCRDYSDPAAPKTPITKPDIAAPGVAINSAHGRDTEAGLSVHPSSWFEGVRFQELQGTSMAAPMITGVVALMLEKKPDLNITNVREHLVFAPRAAPVTFPDTGHAFGVGMVDALTSHKHVT